MVPVGQPIVTGRGGALSEGESRTSVGGSHYLQIVVVLRGSGSLGRLQSGRLGRVVIAHRCLVLAQLLLVDLDVLARGQVQGRVLILGVVVVVIKIGIVVVRELLDAVRLRLLAGGGLYAGRSSSLAATSGSRGLGGGAAARGSRLLALSQGISISLDRPELELDPIGSRVPEVFVDLYDG